MVSCVVMQVSVIQLIVSVMLQCSDMVLEKLTHRAANLEKPKKWETMVKKREI